MVLISCSTLLGQKNLSKVISFYKVPLVCGAAPDIGCGSRAKPALLAMEQNKAISEAWLNRAGTVYAVVWKEKDMTQKVARPIFKKHSIAFEAMNSSESPEMLSTFRQDGKWLRGADVDKLSMEEAERIAESTTGFLLNKNEITPEEYSAIKPDIEDYFKNELVKVRTLEELMTDSQETFIHAILNVYIKHIGKERTSGLVEKYADHFGVNNDCCKSKKSNGSCPLQKS
jgi:hypothetical protein